MGVAGLWDILRPAGETRSLTHLAVVDGFEANPDGVRGFRVGIDASIWFYHAAYGREGENPELRTLFFKCTRLMSAPFLPLFVFDGPNRPEVKRGKRISGKNHWMIQGMQKIIDAFGFEWRMAPGEAEAELAYLNRAGVIDAVYTDDVDTFLFGAKMIVRNASITLSGNRAHSLKNSAGRDDGNHVATYTADNILHHPSIQLTQAGLILIGILRGGDYHQAGLSGCGGTIAHGLAKCGFGDTLVQAARTLSREELLKFLHKWREELRIELRTNARGHIGRKHPSLAKSIPDDFPNIDVLLSYTNPITTEAKGSKSKNLTLDWTKEPDLGKIAELCELYFEWGVKEIIIKRFRTVLWPAAVLRILRRAALLSDKKIARITDPAGSIPTTPRKKATTRRAPGTPSSMIAKHFASMHLNSPKRSHTLNSDPEEDEEEPLIVKIHSTREHASTDGVLEYRLEVAPAQLVHLCEAGVKGLRKDVVTGLDDSDEDLDDDDDDGSKGKNKIKKPPPDPQSHLRIWLPACMVRIVEPELVEEYEGIQEMRQAKKAGKVSKTKASKAVNPKERGTKKAAVTPTDEEGSNSSISSKATMDGALKKTAKKSSGARIDQLSQKDNLGPSNISDFFMAGKGVRADKKMNKGLNTTKVSATFTEKTAVLPIERPPIERPLKSRVNKYDAIVELSDSSEDGPSSSADSFGSSRLPSLTHSLRTASSVSRSSSTRPDSVASVDALQASSSSRSEPSKARFVPAPFPMSFEDFEPSFPTDRDYFDNQLPTKLRPRGLQQRTRQRSVVSSDSDRNNAPLQKSPRKSKKQSSPYSKMQTPQKGDSEDDDVFERAGSPTPLRGRPVVPTVKPLSSSPKRKSGGPSLDRSIIEISSDSDTEDHIKPTRIAPLLLAKEKSTRIAALPTQDSTTSSRRANVKTAIKTRLDSKHRTNVRAPDPDDIIDLT